MENQNCAATFEIFETTQWRKLNQIHAKYVGQIQQLRTHQYRTKLVSQVLRFYFDQIERSASDWVRRCVCLKYVLLILGLQPVQGYMRAQANSARYNNFCELLRRKIKEIETSGQAPATFFIENNAALIERVTQLYTPVECLNC